MIFIESILKLAEETNIDSKNETGGTTGDQYDSLVTVLKSRFESDNLMFARMREEIDSTANRSEGRVVVTGIHIKHHYQGRTDQGSKSLSSWHTRTSGRSNQASKEKSVHLQRWGKTTWFKTDLSKAGTALARSCGLVIKADSS